MNRPLFLRWLLIQALAVAFLVALGVEYGHFVKGASFVALPVILVIGAAGAALSGRLCWALDTTPAKKSTLIRVEQGLENVSFASWACQIVGIMATVFGFWLLLGEASDTSSLGDRIQNGAGVALVGTFIGIFCSLLLAADERLIRHQLEQ